MSNPNEVDFFIGYTRRSSGLGIACAACHEVLDDRVPTPVWIFIDRAGSRPVCATCAYKYCPLMLKILRTWYPQIDAPRTVPGSARGKPPELSRMGEYRAIECDVVSEYATEVAVETIEITDENADELRRAKEANDLDDDDDDDDN
jgi:hypothetical protein